MVLRRWALLLVGIAGCSGVWGQSAVLSPYSSFGLGELVVPGYSRNLGMAGVGVATFDYGNLGRVNPATYGDLVLTTVEVAGYYRRNRLRTENETESFRTGNLQGFAYGLKPNRGPTIVFGLSPFSSVGYSVRSTVTAPDSTEFQNISEAQGGINEAFFGVGRSYFRGRLGVGAQGSLLFGNTNTFFRTGSVLQTETDLLPTITREDRVRGFTYRLGLTYSDTLRKGVLGRVGLTVSGGNNLSLSSKTTYTYFTGSPELPIDTFVVDTPSYLGPGQAREGYFADSTIVLEDVPQGLVVLPLQIGFGLGIQKTNHYGIYLDAIYQQWTEFAIRGQNQGLQDAYRISLGGELTPNYTSARLLQAMTYRAGFRAEKTYLRLSGQDIYQYGMSLGFTLPLRRSFSSVSVATEYGLRGTRDAGLIQESYFQLTVGLSFTERWFVQRKYD